MSTIDDLSERQVIVVKPRARGTSLKPHRSPALTVVTTSELQTFRDCPNKHHFKYRERLRVKAEAKALAFGSIFHGGMSAGITAAFGPPAFLMTEDQRLEAAIAAATANLDSKLMDWAGKQVAYGTGVDYDRLAQDAEDGVVMLKWMLEHYFSMTRLDFTELRLVETERAFQVNVVDRAGRKSKLDFAGVRDAVFYDPRYNQLVLHEHKTVSSAPSDIGKRAEMDPQTCGYVYSLRKQHAEGAFWYVADDGTSRTVPADATVGRVAYNAVRKKKPSIPKVNQDGTVSVAAIDTLGSLYRDALREQVQVRGKDVTPKQAELLARLEARADAFMYRHEFQRADAEVERWRSDTFADASRLREANRRPELRTRNPGHCSMAWSMPCEYRGVCIDDTPELRAGFRVAEVANEEVREAEEEATVAAQGVYVAPF